MGFEEYLQEDVWNFIEWPEKIPNFIEEQHQKLELEVKDQGLRLLKLS